MSALLAGWWRLIRAIGWLERVVGVLLISSIVITISIQVCTRYFFGQPLVWVEELAQYSFIWMVFVGAALGFKEMRHIRIDTFVGKLPAAARALWRAVLFALMTAAAMTVAYYAWDIMAIEGKSNTIALPIELPRMWFYSVPLMVGTTSMALTGAYFVLAYLMQAFNGRPVDAEVDLAARRELESQDEAHELARYDQRSQMLADERLARKP